MKIDIISGFLGAGKTTFIKRLLKTNIKNEQVVLIENEFGEVSVDGDFLRDSEITISELSQGCICCSLVGDFAKNLGEVISKYNPERILIEPSGVGKLSDVKKAIIDAGLGEYLNSFVCLVDATKAKMYAKNFGEFFADQISSASTVILSRTDKASEAKITEAVEIVRSLNSSCVIITTPINELGDDDLVDAYEGIDDDFLEELMSEAKHYHEEECDDPNCSCHHHHHHDDDDDDDDEDEHEHHHHHEEECDDPNCSCHHHHDDDDDDDDDEDEHEHHHHHHDEDECDDPNCCCHHHHDDDDDDDDDEEEHEHHHHHHHADDVFASIGIETVKTYDKESFTEVLNKLAYSEEFGVILRAKGIVKTTSGWVEFNLTPEEIEVVATNAIPTGKICVIGSKMDEAKIKNLF